MSKLCDKYGLKEEQLKAMVKDGVISTTWPYYDEIIIFYKSKGANSEAIKQTSEKFNVDISTVYKIVKKLG